MERTEVLLTFEDSPEGLDFNRFSEFLYFFRGVYAIAVDSLCIIKELDPEEVVKDFPNQLVKFKPAMDYYYGNYPYVDFYSLDLKERELVIGKMKKQSPLEIWALGLPTALVMAVIISGGEVDLKKMKFKLPPLGEGLQRLRIALFDDIDNLRLAKTKQAKKIVDEKLKDKDDANK